MGRFSVNILIVGNEFLRYHIFDELLRVALETISCFVNRNILYAMQKGVRYDVNMCPIALTIYCFYRRSNGMADEYTCIVKVTLVGKFLNAFEHKIW